MNHRIKAVAAVTMAVILTLAVLVFASAFVGVSGAAAPAESPARELKSPQESFKNMANNLANIPDHWEVGNPVQIQVLFNLKFPVNSTAADEFLRAYVRFEQSFPYHVDVALLRIIAPNKYQYAVRLGFKNWHEFQVHEKSAVFQTHYFQVWKPNVPDSEVLFTLSDSSAMRSDTSH